MEENKKQPDNENNSGADASYAEITGIIKEILYNENVKMFDMNLPTNEIERIKGRIEIAAFILRKIERIEQPDYREWTKETNEKMIECSRLFSA